MFVVSNKNGYLNFMQLYFIAYSFLACVRYVFAFGHTEL